MRKRTGHCNVRYSSRLNRGLLRCYRRYPHNLVEIYRISKERCSTQLSTVVTIRLYINAGGARSTPCQCIRPAVSPRWSERVQPSSVRWASLQQPYQYPIFSPLGNQSSGSSSQPLRPPWGSASYTVATGSPRKAITRHYGQIALLTLGGIVLILVVLGLMVFYQLAEGATIEDLIFFVGGTSTIGELAGSSSASQMLARYALNRSSPKKRKSNSSTKSSGTTS